MATAAQLHEFRDAQLREFRDASPSTAFRHQVPAVTVRTVVTDSGAHLIRFTPGDERTPFALTGPAEIAMALNHSGAHLDRDLTRDQVAALVVDGVHRIGLPALLSATDTNRMLIRMRGTGRDRFADEQRRAMWTDARMRLCTDLAYRLTTPVPASEVA